MAPFAPIASTPSFGPIDFSLNKKKLVAALTANPKNDVAAEPKKKSVAVQAPAPVIPTPTPSMIVDHATTLRSSLKPASTIGQAVSAQTATVTPIPVRIEEKAPSTTIPSIASVFSAPQASASEGLWSTYMNDPSISQNGKKTMQGYLDNGTITKDKAEEMIANLYAKKQKEQNDQKQVSPTFKEFAGKARKSMEETLGEYEKQQAELDKLNPDRNSIVKFIQGAGAGANILTDLSGAGISTFAPDFIKEGVKSVGSSIVENTPDIVKEGLGYTADKIGQAYNIAKENFPETIATAGGVLNSAGVIPGFGVGAKGGIEGAKLGVKAAEETVDAVKKGAKAVSQLSEEAKVALSGIDKSTQQVLRQTPKKRVNEYLEVAQKAIDDVHNKTPLAFTEEKANQAMDKLKKKLSDLGARKSAIMDSVGNKSIDLAPVKQDFNNMLDRFNLHMDADGILKINPGREARLGEGDIKELQKFSDNIMSIHTADNMSLKNMDDMVDRIQSEINFNKLNRPGNQASSTEKTISGFLEKSINSRVKQEAGKNFVKANDAYKTIRGLTDEYSKLLGTNGSKIESLFKTVFSPQTGERTKRIFRPIKEITGIDLINESVLAKFAMDAVGDRRATNLLEALDIGKGFSGVKKELIGSGIPFLGSIINKGVDIVSNPLKVGKDIAGTAIPTISEAIKNAKK